MNIEKQQKLLLALIVACCRMSSSHGITYHNINSFKICGLVSQVKWKEILNEKRGNKYELFSGIDEA